MAGAAGATTLCPVACTGERKRHGAFPVDGHCCHGKFRLELRHRLFQDAAQLVLVILHCQQQAKRLEGCLAPHLDTERHHLGVPRQSLLLHLLQHLACGQQHCNGAVVRASGEGSQSQRRWQRQLGRGSNELGGCKWRPHTHTRTHMHCLTSCRKALRASPTVSSQDKVSVTCLALGSPQCNPLVTDVGLG